jgi:hypothetical protein
MYAFFDGFSKHTSIQPDIAASVARAHIDLGAMLKPANLSLNPSDPDDKEVIEARKLKGLPINYSNGDKTAANISSTPRRPG